MIPGPWWRRLLVALLIGATAWLLFDVAEWLVPETSASLAQAIACIAFLFLFYACAPLYAGLIAAGLNVGQSQLASRASRARSFGSAEVVVYFEATENANAVGLFYFSSKIYITSGLIERLSDDGLRAILAHEETHLREHHILIVAAYGCFYTLMAQISGSVIVLVLGLLVFLALRRHLEFRADSGGARIVGNETMRLGLCELAAIYPSRGYQRWLMAFTPYPTLAVRDTSLLNGHKPWL